MSAPNAPRIVVNPNQTLDGHLEGRGYHLTIPICDGWIERLHPRIIVCFPERVYIEKLGNEGVRLMRELFNIDEVEEMYFYSHSAYVYAEKPVNWEVLEPKILAVLKDRFAHSKQVRVVATYDESLCHPDDSKNHHGLAPA